MSDLSLEHAATADEMSENRRDNRRLFDWPVVIMGVAFCCTAAWIGLLLWLIVQAVGVVLA